MWRVSLETLLEQIKRPPIFVHLKTGYLEWSTTATLLKPFNDFWSHTFEQYSLLLKAYMAEFGLWASFPIIGTAPTPRDLAGLTTSSRQGKLILDSPIITLGQIVSTNANGQIQGTPPIRPFEELKTLIGNHLSLLTYMRLKALIKHTYQVYAKPSITHQPCLGITTTIYLCKKFPKGCNFFTNILLSQERRSWKNSETPSAYFTMKREGILPESVTELDFQEAHTIIWSSFAKASDRNTARSSLLRTLWTNQKERLSCLQVANRIIARGGNPVDIPDGLCANCNLEQESTQHLLIDCTTAALLWKLVSDSFTEAVKHSDPNFSWTHDKTHFFFHKQPPSLDKTSFQIYTAYVIAAKALLYNLRHNPRPNPPLAHLTLLLYFKTKTLLSAAEKSKKPSSLLKKLVLSLENKLAH